MTLQTKPVEYQAIAAPESAEKPSAHHRARVEAARDRQRHRFRGESGIYCNAQMGPSLMRRHCQASPRAQWCLERAMELHGLSARAHDRILKLALSRADLEGHDRIEDDDMQLAIDCRMLDRRSWLSSNITGAVDLRGAAPPPWGARPGWRSQ